MLWIVIGVAVGLVLFLALTCLFAKLRFVISYVGGQTTVKVGGKTFLVCLYRSRPEESGQEKPRDGYIKIPTFQTVKEKFQRYRQIYQQEKQEIVAVLKKLEQNIEIRRLDVAVDFGFENAAVTGMANGFMWSAIGAAMGFFGRYISIAKVTNLALTPHFDEKRLDTALVVVFDTRLYRFWKPAMDIRNMVKRIQMLEKGGA